MRCAIRCPESCPAPRTATDLSTAEGILPARAGADVTRYHPSTLWTTNRQIPAQVRTSSAVMSHRGISLRRVASTRVVWRRTACLAHSPLPKPPKRRITIDARVSTLDQDPQMQLRELRAYARHHTFPMANAFI
jgi:hypothetical protein